MRCNLFTLAVKNKVKMHQTFLIFRNLEKYFSLHQKTPECHGCNSSPLGRQLLLMIQ